MKSKLLGSAFALFINPGHAPKLTPGKGWWTRLKNRVSIMTYAFRKWLAGRRYLQRGYSHVGVATVEEHDGVAMAWALDNYPNAKEGGIRKIGIMEQYSLNGPFIRFGVSRFDSKKLWDEFQAQAEQVGWTAEVSSDDLPRSEPKPARQIERVTWPAMVTKAEWQAMRAIPRGRADELAKLVNKNAMWVLEAMLTNMGIAFAYGFSHAKWEDYCSATVGLAYKMGAMFEIQSKPDHWHWLVKTMKKLGIGKAKTQNLDGRIIWPGSFFVDPKVGMHEMVDFPKFNEVGRVVDPLSMPPYVEMDRALTRKLAAKLQLSSEQGIQPDEETIYAALRAHIDSSADKSRSKAGIRSNAAVSTGYTAGLNELIGDEE